MKVSGWKDLTDKEELPRQVEIALGGEYSVIEVLLGDSIFPVSPEVMGDLELEYGQWVSFQIHQLLLWEEPAAFLPGN